jgi:hypothetical protein
MASSKRFYSLQTNQGMKLININNIACIEEIDTYPQITMNVKRADGNFIEFIASDVYDKLVENILKMDKGIDE